MEPITATVPAVMKKFDIKKAQELIPKHKSYLDRKIILEEPDQPETDLRLVLYKYFDNLEEEELNTITIRKVMTDLHLKGPRAKAEILKNFKRYIAPVEPKKPKLQFITEINDETIKIINEAYKKTTQEILDMYRAAAKKKMPIGRKKADKIKNAYNWIKEGYNASFQKQAKPAQPVPAQPVQIPVQPPVQTPVKPVPKFKPIPKFEGRKIILEEPEGLKPIEQLTKQELTDELNMRGIASRHVDRPMKISEARKILREQRELDAQKVQRIMDEKKDLPPSSITPPKTTTISYGNIRKSGKPVKFDMKKATQLISPEPQVEDEIKRLDQKEKKLLREILIKTSDAKLDTYKIGHHTRYRFEVLIYKFTLDEMKKFKKEYDLSKIYSIIPKLTDMEIWFAVGSKFVTVHGHFNDEQIKIKKERETFKKLMEQIKTYLANPDLWEEPKLKQTKQTATEAVLDNPDLMKIIKGYIPSSKAQRVRIDDQDYLIKGDKIARWQTGIVIKDKKLVERLFKKLSDQRIAMANKMPIPEKKTRKPSKAQQEKQEQKEREMDRRFREDTAQGGLY